MGSPLAGLDSDVWVSSSTSTNLASPETCDNTDSGAWLEWRAHTHFYWDKHYTLTIQSSADGNTGWADVSSTLYTFRYVGGVITFAEAPANHFIRISVGHYFTSAKVDEASSWALDLKADSVDTSIFQGDAWGRSTGTNKTATGSFGTFLTDDVLADELANYIFIILYTDKSANARWELAGYLTGLALKSSMAGVITQEATFAADGEVWYYGS